MPGKALDSRSWSEQWLSIKTVSDSRSVKVGSRDCEVPSPVRPARSGGIAAHYMTAQTLVEREPVRDHDADHGFAQVIAAVDSEEVVVSGDQAPDAVVDVAKAPADPDVVEIRSVEVFGTAGTKRWGELQMNDS